MTTPGPPRDSQCTHVEPLPGVVQVGRGAMRRPSRMTRPVTILVWGRQAGRCWGPVVVLRGGAVVGSVSSTALWTVPGGTPRASVTRSMWASHRLGGRATMMAPTSRSAAWRSAGLLSASRGEAGVEQGVGEAARGVDGRPQRGGAVAVEEVGGIEPVGEGESARVVATGGELPEDALGGLLPGGVVVGGHEDAGAVGADVGAEEVGLPVGEGGAEGGDADGLPVTGQGEGDGVQRSLDESRGGSGGQRGSALVEPEQVLALAVQVGARGVEVLGPGAVRRRRAVGLRRAMKPRIAPSRSWMGKVSRSRNRSISAPVRARWARPAASNSSSVAPRPRRWSTSAVQPAGA